jgi:CheY-like chemotaxis protein
MNPIRHDGAHSSADNRSLRILIVDDCLDYRQCMALLLGGLGHEVVTTFDARVALSLAIRNPPDVVFLDIALTGMDGYELARRLRAVTSRKSPLLVAVTGCTSPGDFVLSRKAGIDRHLLKPVAFEDICNVLARVQEKVL